MLEFLMWAGRLLDIDVRERGDASGDGFDYCFDGERLRRHLLHAFTSMFPFLFALPLLMECRLFVRTTLSREAAKPARLRPRYLLRLRHASSPGIFEAFI